MRALLLAGVLVVVTGCISRQEIKAYVWENNTPIPAEVCTREPSLRDRGFYRRLNTGKFEFISFCSPVAHDMVATHKDDFNRILDATLPKE